MCMHCVKITWDVAHSNVSCNLSRTAQQKRGQRKRRLQEKMPCVTALLGTGFYLHIILKILAFFSYSCSLFLIFSNFVDKFQSYSEDVCASLLFCY